MKNSSLIQRMLASVFDLGVLIMVVALVCKWMKWPGGSFLLIIAAVLALLGAPLVARGRADARLFITMRLAMAMVVSYAVFRLLYWPGATLVAVAGLLFGALALYWWSNGDRARKLSFAAMLVVMGGGVALMATPVHALYHYMFFETPGAQRFMHSGVGHWYRYSWFLYQDGQFEKSAAMLDSAQAEVKAYDLRTGKDGEWILVKLRATQERIADRSWNAFVELDQ